MKGPPRGARGEVALAEEAAGKGGPPGEVVLEYLGAYGVASRRVRKHLREVAILERALAGCRAGSVLDCPCGWGRLAPPLVGEGRRVVFADLSPERLRVLRALGFARFGASLRADALALPFRDRGFDFVLSAHLNYHFEDRETRLRHLRECLRVAGGAALVSYHGALSARRGLRWLGHLLRGRAKLATLRIGELRRAAAQAGFELAAIYPLSRFSGHRYAFFRRAPT